MKTLNETIIDAARGSIAACEARIAALLQEQRDDHEPYGLTPRERYDEQRAMDDARRSRARVIAALEDEITAKCEQIAALS